MIGSVISLDGLSHYLAHDTMDLPYSSEKAVNLGKSVGAKLLEQGAGKVIGDLTVKRALTYGSAEGVRR